MRHRKEGKKFNRLQGPRKAFLRNLTGDLIRVGSIETTEVRAKAIRPMVERFVTIAKRQTLAARRLLLARLHNERLVEKLLTDLGPRYQSRAGGYVRITKLSRTRKRDGAPVAKIEFI